MSATADPRSAPPVRWGVLAPGGIARTFGRAVLGHTRGTIVAVGSRSARRAQEYADEFGVQHVHDSYEALVADPDVQAVYVASPHSEHARHALLAIEAGKHVLVEKAFTQDATQARRVLDAAQQAGVFAMEAMWTRFLPHVRALHEVVARGEIGDPVGFIADHGHDTSGLALTHRLHNPDLAGGALLDLGVYPVSFAQSLFGRPDRISAVGSLTPTGVDGQISIALGFGQRVQASLHTTLWSATPTTGAVLGTRGRIEIERQFYQPTSFRVTVGTNDPWTFEHPVEGGFQYQVAEAARCIVEGRQQSELLPWSHTVSVMETLDEIRRQVGVVYPGEQPG